VLLYGLNGRYLYLVLELIGLGEGKITGMKVDSQGDNFMNTFPEIYRERGGYFPVSTMISRRTLSVCLRSWT